MVVLLRGRDAHTAAAHLFYREGCDPHATVAGPLETALG
jgi:hypothetical protein